MRLAACPVCSSRDTCVWAGVDYAWEQENSKPACPGGLGQGKMLENAADRASEPPASIAQNKRIGACNPTLPALSLSKGQVHAVLGGHAKHQALLDPADPGSTIIHRDGGFHVPQHAR